MPLHHRGRWRLADESHNIRSAFTAGTRGLPELQQFAAAAQTDDRCSTGWLHGRLQERNAASLLIAHQTGFARPGISFEVCWSCSNLDDSDSGNYAEA